MSAQPFPSGVLLAALLMVAGFALILLLAWRRRARRRPVAAPAAPPLPSGLDAAALAAALSEAETAGQTNRLPGLYLSLAHCRLAEGDTVAAEDLFGKSIRYATAVGLSETHAQARVALGDMALDAGDRATACEHWQIARGLFHELKRTTDHRAVEARMHKNGCPTDWVLTDF